MTQHYIWLLAGKFTARPLRIAEILSATYVIAFFLPAEHPLWRHRALAFFRMAGRRALPVFCGSVVISAVGLAYAQCCAGGWYRTAGGVLLLLMLLSMWTVAVSRFLGPGRFKAEP
jgi:hypothetical protein